MLAVHVVLEVEVLLPLLQPDRDVCQQGSTHCAGSNLPNLQPDTFERSLLGIDHVGACIQAGLCAWSDALIRLVHEWADADHPCESLGSAELKKPRMTNVGWDTRRTK